ncbi:DUF2497 domain-containing protein [Chelatococcus sp. GCM10030263]|uniref:PopZ family protein n=1 Tax=Chelatococcus sp. GCM10030263 TaxID=3273387 RepID=UPI00360F6B17
MDEILASIRRIIADDQALGQVSGRRGPPQAAAFESGDVDEGGRDVRSPYPPAEVQDEPPYGAERSARPVRTFADAAEIPPAPRPVMREAPPRPATVPRDLARAPQPAVEQQPPVERHMPPPRERQGPAAPPPRPAASEPQSAPAERPPARDVFSDAAERLLSPKSDATVASAFDTLASSTTPTPNGRSLEDLVRDMLRPMLKSWLDDNLPSLVERLVRQEIERVARGSR